ncbi:STAS domain-containing protein [Spirillospora sp. NPDC049024]|uniref:STAS domain-containing protein n=1 Tax=Actinomadura sp. K4S16 TaxID=1316147 RepID=UPI0011EFFB36|nr:STAS domain-containing protein [Actinomadura sp. K4S16]
MRTPFTTPSGISVEFTGRHALLRLPPDPRPDDSDDLRECSRRLLDDGVPAMVLDLTGCRSCDPDTAGAILRVHVHAAEVDTPLTVRLPPSGTVPRVCATTGVSRRVPVEEPETAASRGPRPHPQRRFRR